MFERIARSRLAARCDRCLAPSGPLGTTALEARARLVELGWTPHPRAEGQSLWTCPDCGAQPPIGAPR